MYLVLMPHARIAPKGIASQNAAQGRALDRTILHPTTAQSLVSVRYQVQAIEKKVLPARKITFCSRDSLVFR